nr:MAG TPA: hypothetical protein [Caudoviricetes sp.]
MKIIISDVFEKWIESIKDKKTKVIVANYRLQFKYENNYI